MLGSDTFGDSDDEALLFAATQQEGSGEIDDFEGSPRPRKRARIDGQHDRTSSDPGISEEDLLGDDTLLEATELADKSPNKRERQLYAPRINANLDRVILTQTQPVPQSQPWEIRGPVWKKPIVPTPKTNNSIGSYFNAPQKEVSAPTPAPAPVAAPARTLARVIEASNKEVARSDSGIDYDPTQDLANLPSDAFSSSPGVVVTGHSRLRAPQAGLRQTTLFGREGANVPASQVNKRHNWPLADKDEPPTHHDIDREAMQTWVYPTNLGKIRDYQFNIVHRGLFHNLLVALPTGLGKTFIAATIILNYFRWTKSAQIIFVAPTKPLVAQQVEACFNIAGIPRSQTTMLTGEVNTALRADEWEKKRVFFMTPQTLINDLKTGICDPKRIVLIVIDEAHRATGAYAYVEVVKFIRRFNESFRILGLTATPGGDVESVQKVIDGIDISRCEIRTEQSLDIREYIHQKEITKQVFAPNEEMELLFEWFSKAAQPMLDIINTQNAYWVRDPLKLTRFGLLNAQREFTKSDAGRHANQFVKGMLASAFAVLQSLAFALELLKYYSIRAFYDQLLKFRKEAQSTKSKYRKQVNDSEAMERMMVRLKAWHADPEFVGHPKLEQVRAEVLQHLIDAGEGADGGRRTSTRIEIFSQYRESVEEIYRVLLRDAPIVRPHVFVGQSSSEKSEGMSQKKQLEVTQKFKSGEYNVLISTQVGEEGLDIGELDLIICYDSKASPIRLLQRMGRTGRKREGRVVWLQMQGKEQDDAMKAMDNYEKMQELIASGDRFEFHFDRSRRIVPKDIQPQVDKRTVEIPVENTQRTPSDFLPVPTKKGRGKLPKRPPKKFCMPYGVITGFTKVVNLGEVEELLEEAAIKPPLDEILLSSKEMTDLERRYQTFAGDEADVLIAAPALNKHPKAQTILRRDANIPHGLVSRKFVKAMQRISNIDDRVVEVHHVNFRMSFLEPNDIGRTLVEEKVKGPKTTFHKDKPMGKSQARTSRGKASATEMKTPKSAPPAKKKDGKATGSHLSDMEAEPSSEPNTSPRMAMRSQAVDLGSQDTEGPEEEDGYMDSDLEDFVVDDDHEPSQHEDSQRLSQFDSSLPSPSSMTKPRIKLLAERTSLNTIESSQELPEVSTLVGRKDKIRQKADRLKENAAIIEESDEDGKENRPRMAVTKRRRVVSDDEDDDE